MVVIVIVVAAIVVWVLIQWGKSSDDRVGKGERAYRPERPTGPYSGPEGWQQKGLSSPLFAYATERGPGLNDVTRHPFASVDFETTGLKPYHKHRVIEVAVAQFRSDGTLERTFSSLINPSQRIDNTEYHGISDEDVILAPTIREVLPYVLHLLNGRVLVSHNAPYEEAFLFHEAQRVGLNVDPIVAVDTLSLARNLLELPNHRLTTACEYLGIKLDNPHVAEADAIAAGMLFVKLATRKSLGIGSTPGLQRSGSEVMPKIRIRPPILRKGTDGYMADLIRKLPLTDGVYCEAEASRYIETLAGVLSDGKVDKAESLLLSKCAAGLGLSRNQVQALNETFLESARAAALSDGTVAAKEARHLRALAKELGRPGYFDDLVLSKASQGGRRCGHCQGTGHTRRTCPELVVKSGG